MCIVGTVGIISFDVRVIIVAVVDGIVIQRIAAQIWKIPQAIVDIGRSS